MTRRASSFFIAPLLVLVAGCSGEDKPQSPAAGAAGTAMSGGGGGGAGGATGGSAGTAGSAGTNPSGGSGSGSGGGGAGISGSGSGSGGGGNGSGAGGGGAGAGTGGGPAGSAGSAGAAGANAGSGGGPPVSPNGARFPFPQNTKLPRCTYPTAPNAEDARRAYERWKREVVTADGAGGHMRVKRPNSPGAETNSTVSEGIAYGMMIAVAMDDRTLFDEFWKYSQLWINGNGLMHWYINAAGTQVLGTGGATDSDEDIAWALVMADRQWGGQGSLDDTYLNLAKRQIQAVWDHEIDHSREGFLLAGDEWGGNIIFNPSYFTPNEYRIFGQVTDNVEGWNQVIDTGYAILERSLNQASGNAENGLVPAWCDPDGTPKVPFEGGPTNYQYDSARVPFRIGMDYCYSGEPRAAAYLAKISGFFSGVGAANIVDGYNLDGSEHPDPDSDPNGPQSAVFVGSAAVGGMHAAQFQTLIDEGYALVATGELLARSQYYNLSWTALSLLMLSGNLLEYPAP
jgi:endo-1,4-beta-D-glucanase Y